MRFNEIFVNQELVGDFLREHSQLNVLLQGETSKSRLLEKFIKEPNSVLVATQSFWEGIDVRGEALSLVIIDKLPFSSPDEPLLKARMEDCKLQGGNLPQKPTAFNSHPRSQ